MKHMLITSIVLGFLSLLPFAAQSRAETVTDPTLGFTLKLSPEFFPRPDLIGAMPDVVHAFQYGDATDDEIAVLLFIERMRGVISRKRLRQQDMPEALNAKLFVTRWRGFELDGFAIPETFDGIDIVTYNVQIPLKREAIQIRLLGSADRAEFLKPLLREVLDGMDGESNWLTSAAPSTLTRSENYQTILLCLAIGSIILGVVILWLVSRRTPKGTVLALAVVLYFISMQIGDIQVREIRLLAGILRMLGVAGGILGIIDLCRTRKPVVKQSDQRSQV